MGMRRVAIGLVIPLLAAGCAAGGGTAALAGHQGQASWDPAAPGPSSALLPARVVLSSQTMTAGSSMSGQVQVDNNTGHAIHVSGCQNLFQVLLTRGTYRPLAGWPLCLRRFTIPAGQTSYPITVSASYSQCAQGGPGHGLQTCLPGGRPPPLPPGDYHAMLEQSGDLVWVPPALTVRVTAQAASHAAASKAATATANGKTIRINLNPGATFAPAPPSADPALSAGQAWRRYAEQVESAVAAIPHRVTARLGLLTWPVGPADAPGASRLIIAQGEAYSSLNQLVYGYTWLSCPPYVGGLGMRPPPPTPCIAWLFLDADTGNMIYETWQQ